MLARIVRGVGVCEGGVGGDGDAQLLLVFDPFRLGQVWVDLELMDGGYGFGLFDDILELGWREVGEANIADSAGLVHLFHSMPGLWVYVSDGKEAGYREGTCK